MKSFAALVLLFLATLTSFSQKISMMVDEDLLANSEPMQIRTKGISSFPKYYFGDFKVTDGKAGWTTTNTTQSGPVGNTASKQKFSFAIEGPAGTAEVNAKVREFSTEVGGEFGWLGNFSMITDGTLSLTASIATGDSIDWDIAYINDVNSGISGGIKTKDDQFEVRPVFQLSSGKRPFGVATPTLGYTIYNQGVALAAVQTGLQTFTWIRKDLSDDLKLKLAATAITLLSFERSAVGE